LPILDVKSLEPGSENKLEREHCKRDESQRGGKLDPETSRWRQFGEKYDG
jgi:hypothetical protein